MPIPLWHCSSHHLSASGLLYDFFPSRKPMWQKGLRQNRLVFGSNGQFGSTKCFLPEVRPRSIIISLEQRNMVVKDYPV